MTVALNANRPAAYERLETLFRRIDAIAGARAMLDWDQNVMMPTGSAEVRGEQIAALAVVAHEMITDAQTSDRLAEAESHAPHLDSWERANLREMRRAWRHANAVPADLVEALQMAVARCEITWRSARKNNDYKSFAAPFAEVLNLVRQSAQAKAAAFGVSPYDALVDEYEPGGSAARFQAIFDKAEAFLRPFIAQALERQAERPAPLPFDGPFPVSAQEALGRRIAERMGFDFSRGRLDVSAHPFSGGVPGDIRMTTRYDEGDFTRALMGVIHETGHSLYEDGLPEHWRSQPVGKARGMVMHESQSLLMEMQVGRSREFLGYLAPLLAEIFGRSGPAWTEDNLERHYWRVQPGLIRVYADEVTYPMHVILRFRLEQALLAGDLTVADLPGAWNDGMKDLLGVDVPDYADGCLQDIHWPTGAIGYFPTYSLGAMAAAQIYAAAKKENPAIPQALTQGDFRPLMAWLREHIHGRASLYHTDELLEHATGAPLGPDAFFAHLASRYGL